MRSHLVGAGYREDLFQTAGSEQRHRTRLLYVGKYSHAKGLPWLLEAVVRLRSRHPELELHVAGSGAGAEADQLRRQMEQMTPHVVRHGQVSQQQLASLMRSCAVLVLPS